MVAMPSSAETSGAGISSPSPGPDPKTIYITLYEITKKPPELFVFRKLSLQQK
jgi:hypothetical protein